MHAEAFALWSFIVLIMIVFAESNRNFRVIGLIASFLFIPLAFEMFSSGIDMQAGTITSVSQTATIIDANTTTTAKTETQVFSYVPLAFPAFQLFDLKNLLGIIFLGAFMFGTLYYVWRIGKDRAG